MCNVKLEERLSDAAFRGDVAALTDLLVQDPNLLKAKALQGRDITNVNIAIEWFENHRNAVMVVASLIATMAFQAMISPPGGVWQDDLLEGDNPHRVGESVMARTHPNHYKHLIRANTVAFVSSLSTIILLVRGMSANISLFYTLSLIVMWLSMASIAVVYGISLVAIVPESVRSSNMSASGHVAIIPIMVWSLYIISVAWKMCGKPPKKPSIPNHV